jgi:hypothetical protein
MFERLYLHSFHNMLKEQCYKVFVFPLDEGVEESGMRLFLLAGHLLKILPQNSKGASQMCFLRTFTVYSVLFSPLWLNLVQDWSVISVST